MVYWPAVLTACANIVGHTRILLNKYTVQSTYKTTSEWWGCNMILKSICPCGILTSWEAERTQKKNEKLCEIPVICFSESWFSSYENCTCFASKYCVIELWRTDHFCPLYRASLRQRSRSQLSNVVPDPPLSVAGDHAESMYLMASYEEDDGQAKEVRSNSLLFSFWPNRLYYLVMITCRYVPLLQLLWADTYSWIDPLLKLILLGNSRHNT